MEMPGRRSNYTLLSQYPDDHFSGAGGTPAPYYESLSGESNNNKPKVDKGFAWDSSGDHRVNQQGNRNLYSSIGLQRQSSGSSFGESSLSGDYHVPTTLSTSATNEIDGYGYMHEDAVRVGAGGLGGEMRVKALPEAIAGMGGSSSGKSWAQQTEESYQIQLELALRLSSDVTCADDPNFLDPVPDESASRSLSLRSAEAVSHRFWQ